MRLSDLEDLSILVLGFGQEGSSSVSFLRRRFPDKVIGVADQRPLSALKPLEELLKTDPLIKLHLGQRYLDALLDYRVVLRSPGVPPNLPELRNAVANGHCAIESQTTLFLDASPGPIVGVTGTKGKSTTASLIYSILRQAGRDTLLVGNIGVPALESLDRVSRGTSVIYELSCHQLFDIKQSPHIAVLLNVFREHLDVYDTFDAYVSCKANISRYQTPDDYLVFNADSPVTAGIASASTAHLIPFSSAGSVDGGVYERDGYIWSSIFDREEAVMPVASIPLRGRLNVHNVLAAVGASQLCGVGGRETALALEGFRSLPHRLEEVGTFGGVTFIDDSLATIPEATIGALDALGGRVQCLLLGGHDRHQDFSDLAVRLIESAVRGIALFPTTGERIWQAVRTAAASAGRRPPEMRFVDDMESAIVFAYEHTERGAICLLSPASASFGLFSDYRQRGRLFKESAALVGARLV